MSKQAIQALEQLERQLTQDARPAVCTDDGWVGYDPDSLPASIIKTAPMFRDGLAFFPISVG